MRAHPPAPTLRACQPTTEATGGTERRCYEIRVRGPIGPTTMLAFPGLIATESGHDTGSPARSRTNLPHTG